MNDATKNGASATGADSENNETLDNGQGKGNHPTQERQHPQSQREAMLKRFDAHRAENQDVAKIQGSLGGEEGPDVEDTDLIESQAADAMKPTTAKPAQEAATDVDEVEQFIVKDEAGKAFFKTIVDGKEQLVPLSRARAQLQKHEAADLRLQTASERLREADALKAAAAQKPAQPRSPSTDVSAEDDAAIEARAAELVKSLIEDDEAEAAKKLAVVLKAARAPSATPTDIKTLAVEVAKVNAQKDDDDALIEGYNAYLKEFGEVITDPALQAYQAAKADELHKANPSKSPKEIMLEAGELTCKFAGIERESQASNAGQGGKPPVVTPPANDRQQRKQNLQPVPQSRSAVRQNPKDATPQPSTPQSVVNEMRKGRGQPVVGSQR